MNNKTSGFASSGYWRDYIKLRVLVAVDFSEFLGLNLYGVCMALVEDTLQRKPSLLILANH